MTKKYQIKNITEKQARRIRLAISKRVGQVRTWPRMGYWAVLKPLTPNPECVFLGVELKQLKPEPLLFKAGYFRHQKGIPSIKQLQRIKYIQYNDDEYSFNVDKVVADLQEHEHEMSLDGTLFFNADPKDVTDEAEENDDPYYPQFKYKIVFETDEGGCNCDKCIEYAVKSFIPNNKGWKFVADYR